MSNFTFVQKIYIETIEKYKKENYQIPKISEIAELVGVKSRGTVGDMLKRLKEKGYDYKEETWDDE
jgi:Mn-dependent DtxR family transcriptional regulator